MPVSPNQPLPGAKAALPSSGYKAPTSAPAATGTSSNNDFDISDAFSLGPLGSQRLNMGSDSVGVQATRAPDSVSYGSDWASAGDVMSTFIGSYGTNPTLFNGLRQDLANAGYYGQTSLSDIQARAAGSWDVNAMTGAMNDWLKYVHGTNQTMSFADYLQGHPLKPNSAAKVSGGGGGGGGGSSRAPLQLTSATTLDQVANTQGQQNLGRNLDPSEQAAFVAKYHGEEQTQYNGGAQAGDVSAEAQAQIQSANNPEYQTHLQAGYAQAMLSMLGVK